jgi:uncharacterized protein YdhG (YjbR/CyaY superfamily)
MPSKPENPMSPIDDYLSNIDEPKRSTLQALRLELRKLLPEAEECISYAMPGFRLNGKMVAGFAAFKNHLSYFPHSGQVLPELADELGAYKWATGTLQFDIDKALPVELVKLLVDTRLRHLGFI